MSNSNDEMHTFKVEAIYARTNEGGVLVDLEDKLGNQVEVWLPESQIEFSADNKEVEIPEWLAIKKEIV